MLFHVICSKTVHFSFKKNLAMVMEESNLYCNLIQIEQNYLLKKMFSDRWLIYIYEGCAPSFPASVIFDPKLRPCLIGSELLLFNVKSAIFQLYHGENKLIFNEMMMRSALY